MTFSHKSVLLKETIEGLNVKPDGIYVDGTLGGGGHAYEVAGQLKNGRLIGIDQDEAAITAAGERLKEFFDKVTIVRSNYEAMRQVLKELGIMSVDGILLDLGVSSYQLDTIERGFSYKYVRIRANLLMSNGDVLTLHHITNIDFFRKNLRYCPGLPFSAAHQFLVGNYADAGRIETRSKDIRLVQSFDNYVQRHTISSPLENLPDDRSGIFIDQQAVTVIRVLPIAVRRPTADKLSIPHGLTLLCLDLPADVSGVSLIYHIFQRHDQVTAAVFCVLTVVLVVHSNEAHTMKRKILFDVVPGVNSVPAQAGEVLYHDAVNFPSLYIMEHPLKGFPLKGPARNTVIRIDFLDINISTQSKVGFHDLLLGFQRIAALAVELHGQPDIERRLPDPC